MVDLFLHSPADPNGNAQPVDVHPTEGVLRTYWGELDFGMEGFDVEAIAFPQDICRVDLMTKTTTLVDPGSHSVAEVLVQDLQGGDGAWDLYRINVSRLHGDETCLNSVRVDGAYFVPGWDPYVREYTVYLSVSEDVVKVTYSQHDNGQVVELTAEPEVAPARRLGDNDEAFAAQSRRLQQLGEGIVGDLGPPIGEVQRTPHTLVAMLDVGRQRVVQLSVTSADRSATGSYRLLVQRSYCPRERRFFDGLTRVCTDVCNEGHFGNLATGRCSLCLQEHCAVCEGGEVCTGCHDGFVLQGGDAGGCAPAGGAGGMGVLRDVRDRVAGYEARHQLLVVTALCAASVACCVCLALSCGGGAKHRYPRLLDGEDDDELSTHRGDYGES